MSSFLLLLGFRSWEKDLEWKPMRHPGAVGTWLGPGLLALLSFLDLNLLALEPRMALFSYWLHLP